MNMLSARTSATDVQPYPHGGSGRQLLVDVSSLAQADAGTGIQRVVRATLLHLQSVDPNRYQVRLIAADRKTAFRYLPDDWLWNRRSLDTGALASCPAVEAGAGDLFLGLDLTASIIPRHERQLARWRADGLRTYFFVYDLLPLTAPQWFRRPMRRNFKRWLRLLRRQADHLIAISPAVARDIEAWKRRQFWRKRKIPVSVMPLSPDIRGSFPTTGLPNDAGDVLRWIQDSPTLLMVGTVEPRKGHDVALAAFEQLWQSKGPSAAKLLVVGRAGWKTEALQRVMRSRSGLEGPFLWLERVSDEFLESLYKAAAGVLIATRAEGFGLPLSEAALHGRWALARDLPVFREQGLPNARFFTKDDPLTLAASIAEFVESARGTPVPAELPSWEQSVQWLLELLGADAKAEAGHALGLSGR